jgi:hypothetical protein
MCSVDYLGRTLSEKRVALELFHVLYEVPEPFFDLGETSAAAAFESEFGNWKSNRRSRTMVDAKRRLGRAGFDPQCFRTAIIKEKTSRADGIMKEIEALRL